MNAERRIVPTHHINSVLQEEQLHNRVAAMKKSLEKSPNKLHHAAHTWVTDQGINPLARIIITHIRHVAPKRPPKYPDPQVHAPHAPTRIERTHGHDAHGWRWENIIRMGQWFRDQSMYAFSMLARVVSGVLGYALQLFAVMMFFGPTRTALITAVGVACVNIWIGSSLPVWLSAGGILIAHLILSFAAKVWSGGEEHSGGHGGGDHGNDHGHGHH